LSLKVEWQPSAGRDLSRIDPPVQKRILDAVERFAQAGEGDVKLLRGKKPREYRLRVGGWRVRFAVTGSGAKKPPATPHKRKKRAGPVSLHPLDFDDPIRRLLAVQIAPTTRRKKAREPTKES
jgi:mRNA-degrading endonuclease RelE of RelBE toxin-antitoxin system